MGTWRSITMTCFPSLQRIRILCNKLLLLSWKGIGKYRRLGVSFQKLCDLVLIVVISSTNNVQKHCLSFWFRFSYRFLSLCCLLLFGSFLIVTFGNSILLFSSRLLKLRRFNCIHLRGLNRRRIWFGFRHNKSRCWGRSGWCFGLSWRWWGPCLNWTN